MAQQAWEREELALALEAWAAWRAKPTCPEQEPMPRADHRAGEVEELLDRVQQHRVADDAQLGLVPCCRTSKSDRPQSEWGEERATQTSP